MIIDFVENIVNSLHKDLEVLNQTDNPDGTSIIEIDTWLIKEGLFVGVYKYKVLEVNENSILIKNRDANILTNLKCLQPFFFRQDWIKLVNYLTLENQKGAKERERFPIVFAQKGYTYKTEQNGNAYIVDGLTLFLIDRNTTERDNNIQEKEFNYLYKVRDKLIREFEKKTFAFEYQCKDEIDAELQTNNRTNFIEIKISKMKFFADCKF